MSDKQKEMEAAAMRWIGGVGSECAGWIRIARTETEEFRRRCKGEFPFQFAALFPGREDLKVLDVGSGIGSVVGRVLPNGRRISLRACDPLAPFYNALAEMHEFTPCLKMEFVHGEQLLETYPRDHFDLVHMSNALDHSCDPLHVIKSMLALAKPGGKVHLFHAVNEAESASYSGIHHWNICLDDNSDELLLWNKYSDARINVSKELRDVADVVCRRIRYVPTEKSPREHWAAVDITRRGAFAYKHEYDFTRYNELVHSALYYHMIVSEKLRAEIAAVEPFTCFAAMDKANYEKYHD